MLTSLAVLALLVAAPVQAAPVADPVSQKLGAFFAAKPTEKAPADVMKSILHSLAGPVTKAEVYSILAALGTLTPQQWHDALSQLDLAPWKEKKHLSMLDKLMHRGIDTKAEWLATWAVQVNRQVGLGLDISENWDGKPTPKSTRDIRTSAKSLLAYFDMKDRSGVRGALHGAPAYAEWVKTHPYLLLFPLAWPFTILFGGSP